MSTCISRAGEYSDHEPGDWCPRCGAFSEEAIVAERDCLREALEAVRAIVMKKKPQSWLTDDLAEIAAVVSAVLGEEKKP